MRFKLYILYYLLALKLNKWRYKGRVNALQKKRFNKLRKHLSNSPFYKNKAQTLTVPSDYPKMNKAEFMLNFDQINTEGIVLKEAADLAIKSETSRDFSATIGEVTIGLSTGTSGNRGVFLATNKERAKWVAGVLDRVIGFEFRKRNVAFFLRANSNLYEAVNSKLLAFHFLDILGDFSENLTALSKIKPHILVAQPSMLTIIAKAQAEGKINIKPEKIISVAEVLTKEDANSISTVFKQKVHQVYQCTEGFLAATCKEGTLHFNEDFIHIEKAFVDDKKERFHPVITDLWRRTQPMLNYELNDIVTLKKECSCGSDWMAIEQIEGRSDDIFTFKNTSGKIVKIFPDALRRAVIISDERIKDYAVVLQNELTVGLFIEGGEEPYKNASTALQNLFARYELPVLSIQQLDVPPFEKGAKKRRIKNAYGKIS